MITDGKEPGKTLEAIASIQALEIPGYEIIVGGNPDLSWRHVRLCLLRGFADAGRLGAMRNYTADLAINDRLVMIDDDIIFHPGWYAGMIQYGDDWDALSCRILNPDGSRFWDWKTYQDGINTLLDYDQTSEHVSLTGGYICLKRWVFDRVKWDNDTGFYRGEDVDYSARLKTAGVRIAFNPHSTVTHKAGYTQRDQSVFRTQEI